MLHKMISSKYKPYNENDVLGVTHQDPAELRIKASYNMGIEGTKFEWLWHWHERTTPHLRLIMI
jgi:hypothetical protein